MNENIELYKHISKDCDMGRFTIEKLLEDLKEKDNKIKKVVEDILKGYEKFFQESKKYLKKHESDVSTNTSMSKMGASMGIKKEVRSDNSDSSIAQMMIEGISMGSIDMEKKIKTYEKEVDKKQLNFAKEFYKFQEESISNLKAFL